MLLRPALLLPLFFGLAAPLCPAGQEESAGQSAPEIAASARGATITFKELDRLLLDRYAGSEDGRAALGHLVQSKLLGRLEQESGMRVTAEEVDTRWREADEQLKNTGSSQGIEAEIKKTGLTHEEFRRYLRLSIVHERLTRRALGLDDDAVVTREQQVMWLDQVVLERGCAELATAWTEPTSRPANEVIVAECADVRVTLAEFLPHLRRALSPEDLRKACYQLLLDKRMTARMPDLKPATVTAAVQAEIDRRRTEAESDPRHQGVPFESLLSAQGIHPSSLPRDPVIRVTALSKLWVERSFDEESLREIYANERDFFDGTYGEAVELGLIFLRAVRFPNDLIELSFEDAERKLDELRGQIRTFNEFQRIAQRQSEAPGAREDKGVLGYVTRLDERVPEILRAAAFDALAERTALDPPASERLVGPLRVTTGCVLLWLGDRRGAPPWERMIGHVKTELRRRFIDDEVLTEASVVTWMDK